MFSSIRAVLVPYSLAVLAPCLVALSKLFLEPVTGDESPFLLFVLAVMVTAWFGGLTPSLLATLLSAILSDYLFLSPGAVLVRNSTTENVRLTLFVGEGVFIGWLVASFQTARNSLREASAMKDDFIAVLAHELRNCLGPLQLAAELLKKRAKHDPVLSQARGSVERQVTHISRLVDDLLESSRALRGKITLQKEVLDLRAICQDAAESTQPLLKETGQELTLSLPHESLPVEVDPIRAMQILMNLLTNASKYSGQDGHVWLTAERRKREAVIRIRDNGQGISPEMLPHVFEPFRQSRRASKREGGLGVGLALVKTLVKLHGGKVTAHSEGTGKGSEFVVRIPCLSGEGNGDDTSSPQTECAGAGI